MVALSVLNLSIWNGVFHLNNINEVAKDFWKATEGKMVFAFHGQMGAGKTTFIHALCDAKGVKDVVGSPTFLSLMNMSTTVKEQRKHYFIWTFTG